MDDGGTAVLALLGEDGFCFKLHVSPAGRRSLLAEMATKSLMDNRGEMACSGRTVYSHLRGVTNSVFAELGHGSGGGWRDIDGEREAVTRETWPERDERDMWPVRDTDAGSYHGQARRPVVPSAKMPVYSSSNYALGYSRNSYTGSRVRNIPVPYVSSYQVEYCQSHPNASSFNATEFPRQTSKPNTVTGNFVVGEGSNEHIRNGECSRRRSHYSRSSDEYGSFYYRASPSISPNRYMDEEAFVSSLRRYPRSTPDRSKSIDLLQSIAYLQQNVNNKNIQAKTLRYLREKAREVETELQKLQEKLSTKRISEEPTRETESPSDCSPKYRETKSSSLRENIFKSQSKFLKAKVKRSQSYENYDYLKTSSQERPRSMPIHKGMDVRYLTDISSELKKFIDAREDTVQMSICPKLSKRYTDHCRLHHRKSTDKQTWCDSGPCRSGTVPEDIDDSCGFRSDRSLRPPKICCLCSKPIPCGCKKQMTRDEFIIQKINDWLQEIPIYPNETFLEKALRADLIKKLKARLVQLPEEPDFVENSKTHIEECVEKLPMWRPESKTEQDVLQKRIVNNLLEKLKDVAWLAIDKEIIEAFDIVKFRLRDSNSVLVIRDNVMKDITEQLRDFIKNRTSDDRAFRDQLRSKVADILAELPIETRIGKKRETLERLAEEITVRLMKLQTKPKQQRTTEVGSVGGSEIRGEFEQKAQNLMKSIPGIEKIPETERNRIQQEIVRKLQEIRRHSDAVEVEGVVQDIISDVIEKTGVTVDKKKLAERLTGQITTAANTGTEEKMLWKIIEQMPELKSVNRPELNKAIKEFAQQIRKIKKSSGDHIGSTVQEETVKFLEDLAKKADKTIKPEAMSKMKQKIGKEMTEHIEDYFNSPHGSIESGKVRMISNWLEEIEQFLEVDKNIRDKMATALSRKLNEIQKQGHNAQEIMPEEILKELQGMARATGVEFNSDEEEEIAGEIMEKITKVMIETADQENAIWEAIDAIPALEDIDQGEHYRAVKDLAMKLQDMKLHGGTHGDVHKETKAFVEDLAKKTGFKLENIKTDLAGKLTKKFDVTPEKKMESERKKWANVTTQQSKGKVDLKRVIHDELRDVLNETSITMNPSIKRDLESLIADQKMRGKTGLEAAEEISRFLQDISDLTMEEAEMIADKLTNNLDNQLGISMQVSPQNRLVDEALAFLNQFSGGTTDTATVAVKKKKLAEELTLKVQEIMNNPTLSKKENEEKIREETAKVLRKIDLKTKVPISQLAARLAKKLDAVSNRSSTPIPGDRNVGLNASVSSSDIALSPITSDTLFVPKRGKLPKPSKKSMDQLEQVIRDWFAQNNVSISEEKVKKLASEFVYWSRLFDESTEYDTLDEEGSLRNNLKQWLEVNTDLSKRQNFYSLVNSLLERLRSIALPSTSRQRRSGKSSVPESTAELSDWVARWCDKLPVVAGSSPQEQAKLNALKQNLVSKLMLKITALNMNPETLNNDFLYENMLSDEIEQLLDEFPQSRELASSRAELKKELIDIVKLAKQNIKEELAGNTYRQQIKDVIKKILPSVGGYEIIQEKFEGLRSNIADAFIIVVTAANQQNAQAIAKFYEEADKCIAEYTKLCGSRPNACELKCTLFRELQNIPIPSAAALKSQLGEIQVRDMVKYWIAQLPLKPNLTSEQEVHLNKIISVLGLRLRELEKENQSNLDSNYDRKLQSEITKWLGKLPLQRDVNFKELSSRFTEFFKNRIRPDLKNIPPCTLSIEDREHMDRIRGRSGDDDDGVTSRLCPSASGRPCMPTVTEISCQTSTSQHKPCRSFSRLVAASSRCCQNSTQTISCQASQTCVTPPCGVSRTDVHLQTSCEMRDQSQCVRSPGSYKQTCRAPRRYHVTNPCNSPPLPLNPCNASYDSSCNPYPACSSHGPPCLQGLAPHMKPPSCLMKRTMKDRPRSSVQIAEPADHTLDPPKYYKESGTTVEIGPRGNLGKSFVQRSERRQQGAWYDCQRPPELSQLTCEDQRGPMRCKKRKDWRRRSILSSKGPCKSCAEPVSKCNRFCTMNCPYPSFLYFRN